MANEGRVLVVGGGVAGLTAAAALAGLGAHVLVAEKAPFAGGHVTQLSCKATDACAQCGACLIEEKLAIAVDHPRITILTGSTLVDAIRVDGDGGSPHYQTTIEKAPSYIDPLKCTDCGSCKAECPPEAMALVTGHSGRLRPFYAIDPERCLYMKGVDCRKCESACAEGAIHLDRSRGTHKERTDAIVLATGFNTFDPAVLSYGYGVFPNVITHLELEGIMRRHQVPLRPSDNTTAERIAFIQCVGSRNRHLGQGWCSRICCASALRLSRFIKHRRSDSQISIFCIDLQTFGTEFDAFMDWARSELNLVRMIPADVVETETHDLSLRYFDTQARAEKEASFGMVVLSAAIVPNKDNSELAQKLNMPLGDGGFVDGHSRTAAERGIFSAGTVSEPMTIAEAVADATATAAEVFRFLNAARSTHHTTGG